MSYVLAQLAPLGALVAAFGIGGFALERAWGASPDPALRPLVCAVLGVLLWMLALFVMACAGVLGLPGVAVLFAACALGAALMGWRGDRSPSPRESPPAPGSGAHAAAFVGAVLLLSAPLWLLALSWEVSWDAGAYHLTLPRLYLEAGGFRPLPGNVYASWPLATELLYAAALAIADHPVAKALHAGFGAATLWGAWLGARAFGREAAGWIAAPLVLASPLVLLEWSIAYVDLASAFFFTAGLVFVARWRSIPADAGPTARRSARRCLWLAGACGGALAGVKVNGVLGAAALFAGLAGPLAARAFRSGGGVAADDARLAWRDAARFALPVAALWLPWLVRSALHAGNPFHPLFHGVFGGAEWSPRLAEQFVQWQRGIGMGRGVVDTLLLPLRVPLEGGSGYARFGGAVGAHWLAVLPLAWPARRHPLARVALLASGAWFALWALGSQQARFLIPILPALALAGALGALDLLGRLGDARLRRAGVALLLLLALGLALDALRVPARRARALLPLFSQGEEALRNAALAPVDRFAATLPRDAKLLLLNTNQAFFLEREYEADSFFEASQIADRLRGAETAEEVHRRLRARGITHVLRAHHDWGIAWPAGLRALLGDPELAPRRFRSDDGRHEVFELSRETP